VPANGISKVGREVGANGIGLTQGPRAAIAYIWNRWGTKRDLACCFREFASGIAKNATEGAAVRLS